MSITKTANWMKQNANINSPLKLRMGIITQCDGLGTASVQMLDSSDNIDVYTMPGVIVNVGSAAWLLQADTSLILLGPVTDTLAYQYLNITNATVTNINIAKPLAGNISITGGPTANSTTYVYPTTGAFTIPAQSVNGMVIMWARTVCTKTVSTDQALIGFTDGAGSPVTTYGVNRWYSDGTTASHRQVHAAASTTAGSALTVSFGITRESGTGNVTMGSGDARFHAVSYIWTPSTWT
jgi:hypothetical protein